MSNENVIAKAGMSTTKEALERYEVLKAMNLLAKVTNNEEFYYNHWIYIVPDEADDEELLDIATEDVDTFNDAVACFLDHWDEYALDGGLYIGKTVYPEPDITKCGCTNDDD